MGLLFNKTITTYRPRVKNDAQGIDVEDFSNSMVVDDEIPASIQQMSQSASLLFQRRSVDVDYEIYTPQRPEAKIEDRIEDSDGCTYLVKMPPDDMAGRGRFFCTYCKRLKALAMPRITRVYLIATGEVRVVWNMSIDSALFDPTWLEIDGEGGGASVANYSRTAFTWMHPAATAGSIPWRLTRAPAGVLFPQSGTVKA